MPLIDKNILSSKFRGCLLGALMGDCLGSPFEGEVLGPGAKIVLQKYFDKLDGPYFRAPLKQYTDDIAMTKSVLKTLIKHKNIDQTDLAKRFVKEYFNQPGRGYGEGVVEVFVKLKNSKVRNPLEPAQEQFGGSGSFGNGGAMRVSPVPLFFYDNYEEVVRMSKMSAEITHTHKLGINGTILQAIAIQQSLNLDPKEALNVLDFTNELICKIDKIEVDKEEEEYGPIDLQPYKQQLTKMAKLLAKDPEDVTNHQVITLLGNNVSALHSVPTAIYCFLRGQHPIPGVDTENKFRRTLHYAISLGGDTDTIASMAGAICGAYLGELAIGLNMVMHCEYSEKILTLADELLIAKNSI